MGKKGESKYNGVFTKGDKFGKYTVFNANIIVEREAKILCECECGVQKKVSCYSLLKGTSKQCSKCGNSLKKGKNPAWRGYGDVPGKYLGKIKRSAKQKGLEFNLDLVFLYELYIRQGGKCSLSMVSIDFDVNKASLDRVDSTRGYTKDNVQWLHKHVNIMKNSFPQDMFIYLCNKVSENHTINNDTLNEVNWGPKHETTNS